MNAIRRSRSLFFLVISLAVCLITVTGCRKPKAKLTAGRASASFDAPNALLTALPINNDGVVRAENVQITEVSTTGGTLTLPGSLPFALGDIPVDGEVTLDANFTSSSAKADTDYTIAVAGTFEEGGHTFKFALEETARTPPASPGSGISGQGTVPSNTVNGAHFPAQPPSFGNEVNEPGHGRRIPTGPVRPVTPSTNSTTKPAPGSGGSASISFPTNDPLGINSSGTAEPSGASDPTGKIIFEAANWYAAFSTDGGATFTQLNPTTIFPNNVDGGFCCDQIVQYAPSIDRFIWVLQYGATTPAPNPNPKKLPTLGPNLYRIASASPASVKSSGGTAWSYFDITSTAVLGSTSTSWLDYPDTAIGSSNFFLSFDDVNNVGHVIVRVPLSDIKAGGTINYGYTKSSDSAAAYGGHLSQNTRDEIFWAGHNTNSAFRVFNWPDSTNTYSWRDINIGSWPQITSTNKMTSTTPDNQDWLNYLSGFPGNSVLGIARSPTGDTQRGASGNLLYFAWTGAIGNGFKQPQVDWITLDRNNNFALVNQQEVWNASYAFAYPDFAVNNKGEIGMSLEYGGGGNYENHVAGFWGDYVVYITTNSNIGSTRFGDRVTIRNHTADLSKFDAFGYGLNKATPPATGSVSDVHYLVFSR
jgi:hypothetical protein